MQISLTCITDCFGPDSDPCGTPQHPNTLWVKLQIYSSSQIVTVYLIFHSYLCQMCFFALFIFIAHRTCSIFYEMLMLSTTSCPNSVLLLLSAWLLNCSRTCHPVKRREEEWSVSLSCDSVSTSQDHARCSRLHQQLQLPYILPWIFLRGRQADQSVTFLTSNRSAAFFSFSCFSSKLYLH